MDRARKCARRSATTPDAYLQRLLAGVHCQDLVRVETRLVPARTTLSYCAVTGDHMAQLLFRNFQLLEPEVGELQGGNELLVEGETVREVSGHPIKAQGADVIDCGGRTLMPGLVDSHVHVTLSEVNIRFLEAIPL